MTYYLHLIRSIATRIAKIFSALLLFSLSASAQRYIVGPGEYTCTLVDTVSKKGYLIAGNAALCPGLPTSGVTGGAGGAHHAGFIVNGNVWTVGDNTNGELGIGTVGLATSTTSASQVTTDSSGNTFTNVVQLCMGGGENGSDGGWTSAALKSDGTVWVWGYTINVRGSGTSFVGRDSTTRPVQVHFPAGTVIKKIQLDDCGLALDTAGNVWTWGMNRNYQWYYSLGRGTSPDPTTPATISLPARAVDIAGGQLWNYALLSNGHLYGWGTFAGYLGVGTGDGTQYDYESPGMGDLDASATPMLLDTALDLPYNVAKIYTNSEGTYAILTDSSIWAWGDNAVGNMGQGTELNFASYTSGGVSRPYAWDLGFGELLIRKPVQIAPGKHNFTNLFTGNAYNFFVYAEDAHGNLFSWGRDKTALGARAGGALGQGVIVCDTTFANINGQYPNSWDRTYPTQINLDSLFGNFGYYSTCPLCIANPTSFPCSRCNPYPAAVTVGVSVTATQVGSSTVILSGSASSSNHIMFHTFTQTAGTPVNMGIQTGIKDTLTGLSPGTYTFKYKVIDSYWNTDSSTVTITLSTARDSIRIQFDTLATQYGIPVIQSNFVQMRGDPSTHVITATGGNSNSITVSSISTANWTPVWGLYAASPGGTIPTSYFTGADTALSQVWLNSAQSHSSGVYQIEVSGLHPSSTYTIRLSASADPDAFNGVAGLGSYQWFGASSSAIDTLNAQPGGVANTSSGLNWASVQPNDSGQVFLAFNGANSSQTAAFLGAITITENSGSGSATKSKADSALPTAFPADSATSPSKDLVLYPNPTSDELFMRLGTGLENGAVITLYTPTGQPVIRMEVIGSDHVLSLGNLTPGVYVLRVSNGTRTVTRKVIKK